MNNIELILTASSCINAVLIYTTINLLRKNEKQEDVMASYLAYMDQLSKTIEYIKRS